MCRGKQRVMRRMAHVLLSLSTLILSSTALNLNYVIEFLKIKEMGSATAVLCDEYDKIALIKMLSEIGIEINFLPVNKGEYILDSLAQPYSRMTGIIVEEECIISPGFLKWASDNRLFDLTRHWLIFTRTNFTLQEFTNASVERKPAPFNKMQYLEDGSEELRNSDKIKEFNMDINKDLLSNLVDIEQKYTESSDSELDDYLDLAAIVDSEVILAVSSDKSSNFYNLYEIHRKTFFTEMLIEQVGKMFEIDGNSTVEISMKPNTAAVTRRKNFGRSIIRAVAVTTRYEYFSKSDELTSENIDYWAMKGIQMSKLAEEQYNFRMLIKCFEEYGMLEMNGSYTGMLKYLAEDKTDMGANGVLMTRPSMGALSYIASFYNTKLGLIYREPALAQVANIFFLAFSAGVWWSLIACILASGALLYLQVKILEPLHGEHEVTTMNFSEVFTFFTGAVFQQGTDVVSNIMSARITMLVFLVTSLFLFTSYTANIVALLQSNSDSIRTVEDFIDSTIEMGFEDIPYEITLIEEDNSAIIRELYRRKLSQKALDGNAYMNATNGMRKVQKELFAYHVELPTAGKLIRKTFEEDEKCPMKTIPIFPNPLNGHAVPKKSPYREILAQAYRWYSEVGFAQRADVRFGSELPGCRGGGGAAFNSIGFTETRYIIILMLYGVCLSIILLIIENIFYAWQLRWHPFKRLSNIYT